MIQRRTLLLCLVATLSACGGTPGSPIEIRDAWSPAAPPGASVVAVYAQVVAREADTLTGASSPLAQSTQMHSTEEADGMMQMRPVTQLELKAGETLRFEPGGLHLMLTGLKQPLPADAAIPVTFHFAKAGEVAVTVKVRPAGDAAPH